MKMTKPEAEVTENQRKIIEEISKDEYITVKRLSVLSMRPSVFFSP
ncbi:MAG: hypothetical protein ACE5H1_04540 [Thermodesulfobacteriota bacterium]